MSSYSRNLKCLNREKSILTVPGARRSGRIVTYSERPVADHREYRLIEIRVQPLIDRAMSFADLSIVIRTLSGLPMPTLFPLRY